MSKSTNTLPKLFLALTLALTTMPVPAGLAQDRGDAGSSAEKTTPLAQPEQSQSAETNSQSQPAESNSPSQAQSQPQSQADADSSKVTPWAPAGAVVSAPSIFDQAQKLLDQVTGANDQTSAPSPDMVVPGSETKIEVSPTSLKADELRDTLAEKIERVNELAQANSLAHYDQSQFYFKHWDFNLASVEIQSAIMFAPKEKLYHRDYCVISLLQGDLKRSLAEFMMVVGLGDPVPYDHAEQIVFNKQAAKQHYIKGIAWGRKHRWSDAIAEFRWALEYAPQNATIERSLAFSYATAGDFEHAEQAYATSFAEDPADGYSHADFAYLLADKGESDKAFNQLAEAVKLEPKSAALHVDMGWMAESKGDLSTAKSEFRQAISLSPRHAGLWAHYGKVLESEGKTEEKKKSYEQMKADFAEAKKAYSQALSLDPSQTDVRKKLQELDSSGDPDKGSQMPGQPRDLRQS